MRSDLPWNSYCIRDQIDIIEKAVRKEKQLQIGQNPTICLNERDLNTVCSMPL